MARRAKYDLAAVAEYARDHTSAEVAARFGFPGKGAAAAWLSKNGIGWRKLAKGGKKKYDLAAVEEYARGHTSAEVAREFGFPDAAGAAACMSHCGVGWRHAVRTGRRTVPAGKPPDRTMRDGHRDKDGHVSGTTGNPVYEWLLDHQSCRMCIDLGWESGCRASARSCEAFLRSKLRPLMTGV